MTQLVEQWPGPKSDMFVRSFGTLLVCNCRDAGERCGSPYFADRDPSVFFRHLLRHAERGDRVPKRLLRKIARKSLAKAAAERRCA